MLKITATNKPLTKTRADLISLYHFSGEINLDSSDCGLDKQLLKLVQNKIKQTDYQGKKPGESLLVENCSGKKTTYLFIVSLGDKKNFNSHQLRQAAGLTLQTAQKLHCNNIAMAIPAEENLSTENAAQAITEGLLLANYNFDKYKKNKTKNKLKEAVITSTERSIKNIKTGINLGKIYSQAQNTARDLVNEPPQFLYPKTLADFAQDISKNNSNITVKIFNRKQIEKMGMGAFLAVDQGSDKDPFFIHLTYTPPVKTKHKIVLIGKSITFDSGGLSLKPSDAMLNMKMDMAGGAAVLGVFSVLGKLQPSVEIHGLLPACENMPSGKAIKVGDVIKAADGTYIEIANTDAEGRLTLADAITYARKLKPSFIIDLATLTGAAIVALGEDIAALMSNDEKLENKLKQASQLSGEKIWPLPLPVEYQSHIKSKIADIKNVGKRGAAGTISAGLFLQHFVKNTNWAHLDIAGPAWIEQPEISYLPPGGSGFGVRLLLTLINNYN